MLPAQARRVVHARATSRAMQRCRHRARITIVPQGSANLERAFTIVRFMQRLPDSIVLFTDGLPTTSDSLAERRRRSTTRRAIRFFGMRAQAAAAAHSGQHDSLSAERRSRRRRALLGAGQRHPRRPRQPLRNPGPTHDPPPPHQVFSLAFLDCICCGFGAIILHFRAQRGHARTRTNRRMLATACAGPGRQIARQLAEAPRDARTTSERSNARVADARRSMPALKNDTCTRLLDDLDEASSSTRKRAEGAARRTSTI